MFMVPISEKAEYKYIFKLQNKIDCDCRHHFHQFQLVLQ